MIKNRVYHFGADKYIEIVWMLPTYIKIKIRPHQWFRYILRYIKISIVGNFNKYWISCSKIITNGNNTNKLCTTARLWMKLVPEEKLTPLEEACSAGLLLLPHRHHLAKKSHALFQLHKAKMLLPPFYKNIPISTFWKKSSILNFLSQFTKS